MSKKKEKYSVELSYHHRNGFMYIQNHIVTAKPQVFEMNEAEVAEMKASSWFLFKKIEKQKISKGK